MALKALIKRKQLDEKKKTLEALRAKDVEFETREAELESAIAEAETDEDRAAVEQMVDEHETAKKDHEDAKSALEGEIRDIENELADIEAAQPTMTPAPEPAADRAAVKTEKEEKRNMLTTTNTREARAFGGMNLAERTAFAQRQDVQDFLTRFRSTFANGQTRAVTGAELLIPTVVLDLIRANIEDYSKLIRRVHLVQVNGNARQPIMGTIPEAVWTEMCATLNELNFSYNMAEVDGYKVGGYVVVCNALLEDAVGLLGELIAGIGGAIGVALDKAILYGTGVKMPLGIATRLIETAQPSDYPAAARPWVDLRASNVITIPADAASGLTLFQSLARASAAAKGRYSRGVKFWAMNEATYSLLQVEAMALNSSGAIVSSVNGTMPVIGGDIVVFGDDIMPSNTIIGGYGDLYLLVERAGTSVGYSDIPLYIQDQTVVKGTARYDGMPVIPEGFVVIGIGGAPVTSVPFAPDVDNTAPALNSLTIGSLTLSPAFNPSTTAYTASTTNATNTVTAVGSYGDIVAVELNGTPMTNGSAAAWASGANTLKVTVSNGRGRTEYTVTVTKS